MKQILETKDGFQWEVVSKEQAKKLIGAVYEIHDDESESLIQSLDEINNAKTLAIEIGFVKKVKEPEKKTYVLFGEDVCRELANEGIDAVIELIKDNEAHDLKKFDSNTSPHVILEAADGWNDYAFITKEEYDQIAAI